MSQLYLWNTISDRKEAFVPLDKHKVTMYVCGPTVYNHIHIGNARPIVVFDLLYRVLKMHYPDVLYARNITDVDDKIIAKAKQSKRPINELTHYYTESFNNDIASLNTLEPTCQPRATDYIDAMIAMITTLLEGGFAYCNQAHVLFEVAKMETYGKLSNRDVADMRAGARVEVADYKKAPADFVLWKPSDDSEIGWDSPWGRGRPGWHLECSVMAKENLGETIDIHGGGKDLIFPHHENEICQSECSHGGKTFARYWVHNGYITVDGDKMAKSTGNFFTLKEVLEKFPGEAVRLALLSVHYRKPLAWSDETVRFARQSLDKWYRLLLELPSDCVLPDPDSELLDALDDNLNTPQAIAVLHRVAHQASTASGKQREAHLKTLRASAGCLGLLEQSPKVWQRWKPPMMVSLEDKEVEALVEQRNKARAAKDFAAADAIRNQLNEAGIALEDSNEETRWSRQ